MMVPVEVDWHFQFLSELDHGDLGADEGFFLLVERNHLLIPPTHAGCVAFLDLLGCAEGFDFSAFVLELGHYLLSGWV